MKLKKIDKTIDQCNINVNGYETFIMFDNPNICTVGVGVLVCSTVPEILNLW